MRSCMMQERPDELVIRCEKLTSCVPRWIWRGKRESKKSMCAQQCSITLTESDTTHQHLISKHLFVFVSLSSSSFSSPLPFFCFFHPCCSCEKKQGIHYQATLDCQFNRLQDKQLVCVVVCVPHPHTTSSRLMGLLQQVLYRLSQFDLQRFFFFMTPGVEVSRV